MWLKCSRYILRAKIGSLNCFLLSISFSSIQPNTEESGPLTGIKPSFIIDTICFGCNGAKQLTKIKPQGRIWLKCSRYFLRAKIGSLLYFLLFISFSSVQWNAEESVPLTGIEHQLFFNSICFGSKGAIQLTNRQQKQNLTAECG